MFSFSLPSLPALPVCMKSHSTQLAWIGSAAIVYLLVKLGWSIFSGLKTFVLSKYMPLGINVRKLGDWAVVTGSTDGIGKAYAHELAAKGLNIVLISRSQDKLDTVKTEIENKHSNVSVKTVAIDFTGGPQIFYNIKKQLTGLDVGVLVNNVGIGYHHPEYLTELQDDKFILDMINVNVTSVVMMTRLFLPDMVQKGRGAIVNVSSASGVKPTPLLTVYSATKAFVDFFSLALNSEVKNKGVIVQSVMPFFVATKMARIKRSSLFVPSPSQFACAAVRTIGVQDRTFGCLSHAVQGWVVQMAADWFYTLASMNENMAVRKRVELRAQRKKQQEMITAAAATVASQAIHAPKKDQ